VPLFDGASGPARLGSLVACAIHGADGGDCLLAVEFPNRMPMIPSIGGDEIDCAMSD